MKSLRVTVVVGVCLVALVGTLGAQGAGTPAPAGGSLTIESTPPGAKALLQNPDS
jgi:hypothetical protein